MNETEGDRQVREQLLRHRLLRYVTLHLSESQVDTAADGFRELLAGAHEELVEEMLCPIFNWSEFWPKCLAAEILGLSEDEEYEWEELVDAFDAREQQDLPKQSEKTEWLKEGF